MSGRVCPISFLQIHIYIEVEISIEPPTQMVSLYSLNFKIMAIFFIYVASGIKSLPQPIETLLATDEVKVEMRNGRGERIDSKRCCRLVSVVIIAQKNDIFH